MSVAEKVKMVDDLGRGMSITVFGWPYDVSESTVLSSRKMKTRSGEASRPVLHRVQTFFV